MNSIPPQNLHFLSNILAANSAEQKKAADFTSEQKELLKKYNAKELLEKYKQYSDPNSDFSKRIDEFKKDFSGKKLDDLINADSINLEKLFAWQNNLITSIDLPAPLNPCPQTNYDENGIPHQTQLSIGLYYGDIIKATIFLSELIVDYWLKHNLTNQFVEHILEQINQDIDSTIKCLGEIHECSLKISKCLQEEEKQKNEEALKELHKKLTKKLVISYKQISKNLILNKTFFYLIFQGLAKFSKERWLCPSKINFSLSHIDTTMKQLTNTTGGNLIGIVDKVITQKPIPLFNLLSLLPLIYSRPLSTGISITEQITNFLLQDLKYKEAEKGEPKKYLLFDILDSNYFFLIKTSLVFLNTIKNLNYQVIQDNWLTYLKNNAENFSEILKEYKKIKTQHFKNPTDEQTKAEFEKITNHLRTQIGKALNVNFIKWLLEKNATVNMAEFKTRLILNVPLYILAIKSLYNHYQKGNLSFVSWDNIKNVVSDPTDPFNCLIIILCLAVPIYFINGLFLTLGTGY